MTVAKSKLLEARALLLRYLNLTPGTGPASDLDPAEVGIVGSPAHVAAGTSYHLGRDDLQLDRRPYSVYESTRDLAGLTDEASAIDVGEFSIVSRGRTNNLRTFSAWLVSQCRAGASDTVDIREVIYSPDGVTVLRWDRLGRRTSGDSSHTYHTHLSEFRDADGSNMVALFGRYLREIGVTMTLLEEKLTDTGQGTYNGITVNSGLVTILYRLGYLANGLNLAARLDAIEAAALDDGDTTVILDDSALSTVREVRDAVTALSGAVAGLPDAVAAEHAARLASE